MHIGDPVHVALHEGDRIKSGIGAVARINAQFQPVGVNFGQHTFDFRFEIHESSGMWVKLWYQPILLRPHLGDGQDPVAIRCPLCLIHLFDFMRSPGGWCAPWRNTVDQNEMPGAMRFERLTGAFGTIKHLGPLGSIVKWSKNHAPDKLQPVFIQSFCQNHRIFGHKTHRTKFDTPVTSLGAFPQDRSPGRVARIIGKFHAL